MSKRGDKRARRKQDYWPTPYSPILPLLPHLPPATHFLEPCAGDGRLIGYLQEHGHICEGAWDIEPQDECIRKLDALFLATGKRYADFLFITNPPWTRWILHPLIIHLSNQHPTWLLFDADWMHTQQAEPYLARCQRIVSVGRIRWLEGQPEDKGNDPYDNCAWYLFTRDVTGSKPQLFGREGDE